MFALKFESSDREHDRSVASKHQKVMQCKKEGEERKSKKPEHVTTSPLPLPRFVSLLGSPLLFPFLFDMMSVSASSSCLFLASDCLPCSLLYPALLRASLWVAVLPLPLPFHLPSCLSLFKGIFLLSPLTTVFASFSCVSFPCCWLPCPPLVLSPFFVVRLFFSVLPLSPVLLVSCLPRPLIYLAVSIDVGYRVHLKIVPSFCAFFCLPFSLLSAVALHELFRFSSLTCHLIRQTAVCGVIWMAFT